MHVLALAASIANALPIAAKLTLSAGICLHFYFAVQALKNKQVKIKHTDASGWEVSDANDFKSVQILNSTVITLFAIFLHFSDNAKQSVLIVSDALSEDDYRRLIVRLKTTGKK